MRQLLLFLSAMITCASPLPASTPSIDSIVWGTLPDGREVSLFTLKNGRGMEARITNYGGILVSLTAPDKEGRWADVVLGFDSLAPYLGKHPFFGCITGRYANRIGGAAFVLDGVTHRVTANSGSNHIHGGAQGFDKKLWSATPQVLPDAVSLELAYTSPAGEEGFPGTLFCKVTYTLRDDHALAIRYQATTDATTVVNLTNHSYFNLAGEGSPTVLDHLLMVPAETFTATNDQMIPTGEIRSLLDTPMDFTQPTRLGERIDADFEPLRQGQGYDHNYILPGEGLRLAARLKEPASGRVMEVRTTEPAVQVYTANHLKDPVGKRGRPYPRRSAICLETQHYPDSPNQPGFPSTVLQPGQLFDSTTEFKFLTE